MALSGSTDYKRTATQIFEAAYRKLGIAVTLTTAQKDAALEAMNLLLKEWSIKGLKVWMTEEASLTLVASDKDYSVTATITDLPIEITEARRRDSNNVDTPLEIISREQYMRLSDKTSTGTPVQVYYHRDGADGATNTGVLYVWPAPDSTAASEYTLVFSWRKPIDDLDAYTDDVEIPPEWYRALVWNTAKELLLEVDVDESVEKRVVIEAAMALNTAENFDLENATSVYFQPDWFPKG